MFLLKRAFNALSVSSRCWGVCSFFKLAEEVFIVIVFVEGFIRFSVEGVVVVGTFVALYEKLWLVCGFIFC
jgi:hypothetical protein